MRILQATTILRYGSGIVVTELCCRLAHAGHAVHVASTTHPERPKWLELEEQLIESGVTLHEIDLFRRDPVSIWRAGEALANLLGTIRFDVVHLHSGTPAYVDRLARQKHRLPAHAKVGTLHGFNSESRPLWMERMDRLGWSSCDALTTVSTGTRRKAIERGFGHPQVAHPGARKEIQAKKALPDTAKTPHSEIVICQVASIEKRKGQRDLVAAAGILSNKLGRPVICQLVGSIDEPAYCKDLEELAEGFSNLKIVHVPRCPDPFPYIDAATICAFPSRAEGLGLSIIECLSRRKPTIFADVEGTRDIARTLGIGDLTFPPCDVSCLAMKLEEMIASPPHADRLAAVAEQANLHFSSHRFAQEHEDLYKRLIDSRRFQQRRGNRCRILAQG